MTPESGIMTGMQALRLLFSPAGRLSPRTFILLAVLVYLAGAASHLLTMPEVIMRTGLWPFIAAQALLIWIWFVVHAKRLRDTGRNAGLAAGVSILYALSVALLIVIAASFYHALAGQMPDANSAGALGLLLVVSIVAVLLGSPHYDLAWLMVAVLLLIAFVPIVLAVVVTMWAAARPPVGGEMA
jgi:uncharacterized membrane protein YhaH (DUF805 family)